MSKIDIEKLKKEKDIHSLRDILRTGTPNDRAKSAKALGLIGDKNTIEDLMNALNDEDAKVRSNAAIALGHLNAEKAIKNLIEALNDESWLVRHDAAIALGELGGEKVKKVLEKSIRKEDEIEVRQKIVEALGRVGDGETIELFMELIDDDDDIKLEVIKAIGDIGGEIAVEILKKKVENGDKLTRELAVKGLTNINSSISNEALILALEDDNWRTREEAVRELGDRKVVKAKDKFLELLDDENDYVVIAALIALGKLRKPDVVDKIENKLKSENPSIKTAVVEALGYIECERSLDILINLIDKEYHPRVLWSTPDSLSKIIKNRENMIKEKLKVYNDERKIILSIALAKAGDTSVISELLDGIHHDSWKVRQKSVEAMREVELKDVGKNRSKKVLRTLRNTLSDNDKWVRVETSKALGEKITDVWERIEVEEEIKALKKRLSGEGDEDVIMALKYALDLIKEKT